MVRLPLLAPLGALVLTLAWIVLGSISPGYQLFDLVIEPYSSLSQPISGLGLGVTGPWMNAAFVVAGLLLVAGSTGVRRVLPPTRLSTAGHALATLCGVGMVVDGFFTLESVMLHLLGFLLAVPLPAVGFVLVGVSLRTLAPRLAAALLVAGPLSLGLFAWFMAVFDPYSAGENLGYAGLVQRVLITVVLATWSLLGVASWRRLQASDHPFALAATVSGPTP